MTMQSVGGWKRWMIAAAACLGMACGGSEQSATGGLKVGLTAPGVSAPAAAALRTNALTAPTANGTITITGPLGYSSTKSGALPITLKSQPVAVGNYKYVASGTGSGGEKFEASGDFDVTAGAVTEVHVTMQQTNATPMSVIAPYTSSVKFTLPGQGSGGWGVPLKIEANVTHPDNDRPDMDWFVYEWKHTCNGTESAPGFFVLPGDLQFFFDDWSKPTAKVTTWFTSFCQGVETITLVSMNTNNLLCPERGCALVSSVSFDIPYDPQGYAGDVSANFAPIVTCGLVDNAEPLPGGLVKVNAVTSDPDADALSYQWGDSCGGSFDDPTKEDVVWTAPAEYCKACTLTVTVTDARGGKNTGTIGVKTAPADVTVGCVAPPN